MAKSMLSNNYSTVAESRHAHSMRISRSLTHISHLTSLTPHAHPRSAAPQLTPEPVDRSIIAKNSTLMVIMINVDDDCSMAKEMVLFD